MNEALPPIKLARPEDVRDKPKIALRLMVKNGASVVGRLIDNVGPYLSEVVAVLNDCEDTTSEVLVEACRKHSLKLDLVPVTVAKYPSLYLLDVPETYAVGKSLAGETYEGPFTGKPILADWATARNIGWEKSTRPTGSSSSTPTTWSTIPTVCQGFAACSKTSASTWRPRGITTIARSPDSRAPTPFARGSPKPARHPLERRRARVSHGLCAGPRGPCRRQPGGAEICAIARGPGSASPGATSRSSITGAAPDGVAEPHQSRAGVPRRRDQDRHARSRGQAVRAVPCGITSVADPGWKSRPGLAISGESCARPRRTTSMPPSGTRRL